MEKIKVSELLPEGKKLKKVVTGSELLFLYELDKYAKIILNKQLSLEGVTIVKQLRKEKIFSFVVLKGLDVGFEVNHKELASYADINRTFFTDTVEGIVFKEDTDEVVHYDFSEAYVENKKMNGDNRESAYISLVAYIIVRSINEGKPLPKIIIGTENYNFVNLEYHHLAILHDHGNKVLEGLVEWRGTNDKIQIGWEAFVMLQRQKGLMCRPYSPSEKAKLLKKNYNVGDVVLYYTRRKCTKGNTIVKLESCYPAVIDAINDNSVSITYYATIETELTRHMRLLEEEAELDNAEDSLLMSEDFNRFLSHKEVLDLTSTGIDGYTYDESVFLLEPLDFDGCYQWLKCSKSQDYIWLSTLDAIYAVFEDRNVEYNREAYLDKFFTPYNRIPVYEQYKVM